jgi:hypothetical protein
MAHFAKIENNIVQQIIVADSKEWCENNLNGIWIQTSYNTQGGVHLLNGTPLRKNYAGIGYTYDPERDAFIAPKPYTKWVLNEKTCIWEAPTPYPTDDKRYVWNDNRGEWEEQQ